MNEARRSLRQVCQYVVQILLADANVAVVDREHLQREDPVLVVEERARIASKSMVPDPNGRCSSRGRVRRVVLSEPEM